MPKDLSPSVFLFLKKWLLCLMPLQRGNDKWSPIVDDVPDHITREMDTSVFNLNDYEDTLSPDPTTSQPTMPEDVVSDKY